MTTVKMYSYHFNRKDIAGDAVVRVEYALAGVIDNSVFFPYYLTVTLKNMPDNERYIAHCVFRLRKEDRQGLNRLAKCGGLRRIQQMLDIFSISETQGAAKYISQKDTVWNKESRQPGSAACIPKGLHQSISCAIRHFLRALSTINSVMSDNYMEMGEIFSSCIGDLELKIYSEGDLQAAVAAYHMECMNINRAFDDIKSHSNVSISAIGRVFTKIKYFFKKMFKSDKTIRDEVGAIG